uniref:Dynein light chain n=1 Tax=Heligmosomoides polygyrus TaxID=6339 RepID=A0A183GQB2_HELPZ
LRTAFMSSAVICVLGDADMDVSEEMEEVRELLYEMIKKNFPMGVSSSHLAQKYHEEWVLPSLNCIPFIHIVFILFYLLIQFIFNYILFSHYSFDFIVLHYSQDVFTVTKPLFKQRLF